MYFLLVFLTTKCFFNYFSENFFISPLLLVNIFVGYKPVGNQLFYKFLILNYLFMGGYVYEWDGPQRKVLDTLELEFQVILRCPRWVPGTES